MAHDVFISYSSKDKPIADAVCATLEAERIRCWIAPRDVMPGVPYGEALIEALNESRVLVLVFSSHSNESPQVMREVERAVSKGIAILPFRIEDVPLCKEMEYYISTPHWLDALTAPMEVCLARLAQTAKRLLEREAHDDDAHLHSAPRAAHTPVAAVAAELPGFDLDAASSASTAPGPNPADQRRTFERIPQPSPGPAVETTSPPFRSTPAETGVRTAMSPSTAFFRRAAATLIDGAILYALWIVGFATTFALAGTHSNGAGSAPAIPSQGVAWLMYMLLSLVYCGGMVTLRGQTLGKMAVGLRVAGPDGGKPVFWRAALRETVGKLISTYVLFMGHLWMLWDQRQQTWHDKMAQTYVEFAR